MTNSDRGLRIVGICTLVVIGFIHLRLAGGAFRNAPYEGALFVAAGIGAIFSALGINSRRSELAWLVGALVAGGTLLAYVISRTAGLPGLPAEPDEWFEPLGVVSVIAEVVFLTVFAMTRRSPPIALS